MVRARSMCCAVGTTAARHIVRVLLTSLTIILAGCWSTSPNDIPGKYTLRDEWGHAELVLMPSGGLVEVIYNKGQTHRLEGSWEYTSEHRLIRHPCFRIDHDGVAGRIDLCTQSVSSSLGGVEISVDPNFGLSYRK